MMDRRVSNTFSKVEMLEKYAYIFLMFIAFSTRIGDFFMPQVVPKIIAIIITVYTFVMFLVRKKNSERSKLVKFLFLAYFVPALVIHLYTLVMILIGRMDSSFFNWNVSKYAPILVGISSVFLFGKKSLKYNVVAIIMAWIFSVLVSFIDNGIGIFPFAINQAYFDDYTPVLGVSTNYLELHDIVLSIGIVAIYFIFKKASFTKRDLLFVAVFLLIFLLGMKRIAIAGLICAVVVAWLFKKINIRKIPRYGVVIGVIISVISFGFVYMIFTDKLYSFVQDINLMGRNYYFDVIKSYGEFSPTFLGTGRNSVSLILTRFYPHLHVGGVHSDILKMFVENGFIMFTAWLGYFLFLLPKMIQKKFGIKTMALYLCIAVYTYVIYLTDNVENYFIFQVLFLIVPYCYYLERHSSRAREDVD